MSTYSRPSELLEAIDSHSVVNSKMLADCTFDTECIGCIPGADVVEEIKAHGLGGWFEGEPDDWFFSGWTAAEDLAQKFLGRNPGGAYEGRGTRFRACLKALKEAGH